MDVAAVPAGTAGVIAEQRDRRPVGDERLAQARQDERRRVVEAVEHAHQAGRDVPGVAGPIRRRVPGQAEDVVALVGREPQRAGERLQHLGAGLRSPGLLEARVVVDRHSRQLRHLLAPQAGRAAAGAGWQSEIARLQLPAAAAQEVGELGAFHPSIMRAAAAASQGSPIPRSAGLSRRSRGARTLERMDITRDTVFIPGATSGIGLALARRLQDRGSTVIIGGRRQELLGRLAAEHGFGTVRIDTTDPERVRAASAEVIARWPEVNAVVLMAGIMVPEDWRTPAFLDTAERIVETNVLGPIRLIAAFIEHLRSRPAATIVTVSSGLASVPLRPTPTYNASKAFVHMLSESIRLQLEGTGVAVTEVVPPSVQTDLMPGQAENPLAMPLGEFADEVLSLLETQPEAHEILVERVKYLRFAEVRGEYDQVVEAVNATDPHARG